MILATVTCCFVGIRMKCFIFDPSDSITEPAFDILLTKPPRATNTVIQCDNRAIKTESQTMTSFDVDLQYSF